MCGLLMVTWGALKNNWELKYNIVKYKFYPYEICLEKHFK